MRWRHLPVPRGCRWRWTCRCGWAVSGARAGFEAYLTTEGIDAVLDATHPFAAAMSHRTAAVCAERGLPYAQVLRPAWEAQAGDRWQDFASEEDVATAVAPGAVVFLATGRQHLERFHGLRGRTVYARQIDAAPDPFPFDKGRWIIGRPPFSVSDEVALFAMLGVDWLIVKNAGGDASRSKLDAARQLGLRVGMIARPAQPDALRVASVAEALDWVRGLG